MRPNRIVVVTSAALGIDDAIFEGDKPMIVMFEESTVSLPRGFTWDWQLSIDVPSEQFTRYEHVGTEPFAGE